MRYLKTFESKHFISRDNITYQLNMYGDKPVSIEEVKDLLIDAWNLGYEKEISKRRWDSRGDIPFDRIIDVDDTQKCTFLEFLDIMDNSEEQEFAFSLKYVVRALVKEHVLIKMVEPTKDRDVYILKIKLEPEFLEHFIEKYDLEIQE